MTKFASNEDRNQHFKDVAERDDLARKIAKAEKHGGARSRDWDDKHEALDKKLERERTGR